MLQIKFNSWFVGSGQISSRPKTRVFTRRGSVEVPEIHKNFRESRLVKYDSIWADCWFELLGVWIFGIPENEMDMGFLGPSDSNPKPKNPNQQLPSGKLTWQWKTDLLKMHSLSKMGIFYCHVSLLEGTYKVEAVELFDEHFF